MPTRHRTSVLPATVRLLVGVAAAPFFATHAMATPDDGSCPVRSGSQRLPVLELYTSEGCSSCPPADRWLSRDFRQESAPPAIPLAFHVDYWNRLGWPDRFSSARYSARQNAIAARTRADTIYTPQFVFDGQSVRPSGLAHEMERLLGGAGFGPPGATIDARLDVSDRERVRVTGRVAVSVPGPGARVYVALFQNGLSSRVTAGENGGRTLHHDFVVREFSGPFVPDARGRVELDVSWNTPDEYSANAAGVAIFAEDAVTGRTLQAASAPVCHP